MELTTVKAVAAAVIVFAAGLHPAWQALAILNVLDVITGLIVAGMAKAITSEASFRGMAKKALMWVLLGAAEVFSRNAEAMAGIDASVPGGAVVAAYYCLTELVSIVENVARAGVPLPGPVAALMQKAPQRD